jgi:protein-L-isoaspartate(D-aspartate) O-methyltransferase
MPYNRRAQPERTMPTDFATARRNMVDGQIRPNKVTDARVIGAMRTLRRELFVPEPQRALAYADEDIRLPNGRAVTEPMVLARLVQAAEPPPGGRALVVGGGTGYGAALLARCGLSVVLLEDDADLLAIARAALAEEAPEVRVEQGPLPAGWRGAAPYDVILIEGAIPAIPPAIAAQATEGGRIATVLQQAGRAAAAVVAPVRGGHAFPQTLFDCATPPLPAFRPAPAFVF